MNIALCTRNRSNPVIQLLDSFLSDHDHSVSVITDPRALVNDDPRHFHVAFWRPDSRDQQIAAFARQAAEILEASRVPFLNSLASTDFATNKFVSYALFKGHGIRTPETWLEPQHWDIDNVFTSGPKIVKPVGSKQGQEVTYAATVEEAVVKARSDDAVAIIQEPIRWTHQLRVVATQTRCIRAFQQEAPVQDSEQLVARFDARARLAVAEPSADVIALATRMVRAVRGDLMRADILVDPDGRLWALEVNASFGFPHDDPLVLEAFEVEMIRVAGGDRLAAIDPGGR